MSVYRPNMNTKSRTTRIYTLYRKDGNGRNHRSRLEGCWVIYVRCVTLKEARFYIDHGVVASTLVPEGIVEFISDHAVRPGSEWPWAAPSDLNAERVRSMMRSR